MSEGKKNLREILVKDTMFLIAVITFTILHTGVCYTCPEERLKAVHFEMSPTNNVMFTQGVLFEASSRSKIDCGRQCADQEGCAMITFKRIETGASAGRCRVYGQVLNSSVGAENSPGARSYAVNVPAPKSCPSGYTQACCRCLKSVGQSKNYTEAVQRCGQLSQGELVMVKTVEELQCVGDFLVTTDATYPFVGADDLAVEGAFSWRDGTPLPTNSPMWRNGQPDNVNNEDCVWLSRFDKKLYDTSCVVRRWFMCQKFL